MPVLRDDPPGAFVAVELRVDDDSVSVQDTRVRVSLRACHSPRANVTTHSVSATGEQKSSATQP